MKVRFVKQGSSLAVRIPSALALKTGIKVGDKAEVKSENGCLIIMPETRGHDLGALVSQITDANRHDEIIW